MNLRDLARFAKHAHGAIGNGRREVQNLRDSADMALNVMDAIGGVTGMLAKKPTVGTVAGMVAGAASRFVEAPAPPQRAPRATAPKVERPQAPKRVKVAVTAQKAGDVIDAEIIDAVPEGVVDPSKPYGRR